jgi:hypothetical protein
MRFLLEVAVALDVARVPAVIAAGGLLAGLFKVPETKAAEAPPLQPSWDGMRAARGRAVMVVVE